MKMKFSYDPSTLGKVALVEVVSLIPEFDERNGSLWIRFQDPSNPVLDALQRTMPSFIANDSDAQAIATLYRQLPPAEPDRCHTPPYGFKFHLSNSDIIYASLCWQCNTANVWLTTPDRQRGFTFDGQSEAAQELFDICRRYLPTNLN